MTSYFLTSRVSSINNKEYSTGFSNLIHLVAFSSSSNTQNITPFIISKNFLCRIFSDREKYFYCKKEIK